MSRFAFPSNPILENINFLFETLQLSGLEDSSLDTCQPVIRELMDLFTCNEQEAVLLATLIQLSFNDEDLTVRKMLQHFGLPFTAAATLNRHLELFVRRDWIRPVKDVRYQPLATYHLKALMISSVLSGDWTPMRKKENRPKNCLQLLEQFIRRKADLKSRRLEFDVFSKEMMRLIQKNARLPIARLIRKHGLNAEENSFFLYCCAQFYNGRKVYELERAIQEFGFEGEKRFCLRQAFRSGKYALFDHKLIEVKDVDEYGFPSRVHVLSENVIRALFPNYIPEEDRTQVNLLESRLPKEIAAKEMFYNDHQQEMVFRLREVFLPERFGEMTERLNAKGLKSGITVLLYGDPGTGKTETVLQLARSSGRTLLMADASKIRSKWLGDTEKNIRELFAEYRSAKNRMAHCPILLFNEADAILAKRRAVADRGDQMENALQNILLEELESFEGIFMATTNLEKHFDEAFDRRFLYKMKFEKPGYATQLAIWKSRFPEVDESMLSGLSKTYSLTGAQVENIQKKISLDALLTPEFRISEKILHKLIDEEMAFDQKPEKRKVVGFARN